MWIHNLAFKVIGYGVALGFCSAVVYEGVLLWQLLPKQVTASWHIPALGALVGAGFASATPLLLGPMRTNTELSGFTTLGKMIGSFFLFLGFFLTPLITYLWLLHPIRLLFAKVSTFLTKGSAMFNIAALGAMAGASCGLLSNFLVPSLSLLFSENAAYFFFISTKSQLLTPLSERSALWLMLTMLTIVPILLEKHFSPFSARHWKFALSKLLKLLAVLCSAILLGGLLSAPVLCYPDLFAQGWGWIAMMAVFCASVLLCLIWVPNAFASQGLYLVNKRVYPLRAKQIQIGKAPHNDIVLDQFDQVFAEHCLLEQEKNTYLIQHQRQGGLVLINGKERLSHRLKSGDVIQVGHAAFQYFRRRA